MAEARSWHRAGPTAAALLLLLAACGRQGGDEQVVVSDEERIAELLEASAFRSRAASSVNFRLEATADLDPPGYEGCATPMPAVAVEGAVDLRTADAWIDADGDRQRDGQRSGEVVVVRAPNAWAAPTPWLSLSVGDTRELSVLRSSGSPIASAMAGTGFSATGEGSESGLGNIVGALDEILQAVGRASTDLTVLGPGEVRGVPTTGYRYTTDLLEMIIANAPPETPPDSRGDSGGADIGKGLEQLDEDGLIPTIRVETHIDEDKRVRKAVMTFEVGDADGSGATSTTGRSAIELWDYDQPVDLVELDPAEVSPFGDLPASSVVGDQIEQIACMPSVGDDPAVRDAVEACVRDGIDGKTVRELAASPADPYSCLFDMQHELLSGG